ncbi:hypothetical protein J2766_001073 [Agrobacterium tumefaciens]|uniref:Uncharacterized protein n=1 Tax=Agrobacterium tumefaciens TaxID=358 RepID=A0AAW8LQJ2_AGRTU|nr:hypothetical protein [Agrobacterium tumefaciens]MBP2564514.1 hypothetical protein [Agrobacterium tumefaciens]MDR6701621.1 hypothetical protein [Agrobacterium tumefaciens]
MNEAQTLTLEAGRYYRTRDGRKAYVAGFNPFSKEEDRANAVSGWIEDGNCLWCRSGQYWKNKTSDFDLVAEWVEPKRIQGKMYIYEGSAGVHGGYLSDHLQLPYGAKVLAVIEIDVLEGHGLGEAA